jgi:cob(I)alamin adenosyltransferase
MATTTGNTGDFKNKQFEKDEVAVKVVEQYDEARARIFYKHVMVSQTVILERIRLTVTYLLNSFGIRPHLRYLTHHALLYRAEAALTFTMVAL